MAAPQPSRCSFFVQKKNRFCKMVPGKGRSFCGEHANMEEGGGGSSRITCPLDPKHTVTQQNLEKHLRRCNAREKPRPVYYVENINAGRVERNQELPEVSLAELSRSDLESLVEKLKAAAEGLQQDMEDRTLSHPVLQEELSHPRNGGSAHKHLRQQASLLGHLQQLGLLSRGRCFVEFGAGRGKLSHWIHRALQDPGVATETSQDLQLLLVERCSTRFKVDGKHQGSADPFERLQVDIQHLDLSKVPVLRDKALPLVGVGKHLCGAATDLALRCLLDTARTRPDSQPPPKRVRGPEPDSGPGPVLGSGPVLDSGPGPVLGLAVALCCHHRCEWRHYVGQQFFLQRGIGPAEFAAFCRMSSWATCGAPANHSAAASGAANHSAEASGAANQSAASQSGAANQSAASQSAASQSAASQSGAANHGAAAAGAAEPLSRFWSAAERERLGRLCKLLIDSGRRDFLRSRGFSSRLIGYIDADVTLENVLLTALPSS